MKLSEKIIAFADKAEAKYVIQAVAAVIVIVMCVGAYVWMSSDDEPLPDTGEQMANDAITEEQLGFVANDIPVTEMEIPYIEMGYDSLEEYWEDINAKRAEADGMTDAVLTQYGNIFDDAEIEQLYAAENKMKNAVYLTDYDEALKAFNDLVDANKPKQTTNNSGSNGSSGGNYYTGSNSGDHLTKSGGVYYYNGHKETWYSSNVLYHYRTDEWTAGSDGVYRDADGYIVVAMDGVPMESTVETSLGTAKVYDRVSADGSREGIVDVYVQW